MSSSNPYQRKRSSVEQAMVNVNGENSEGDVIPQETSNENRTEEQIQSGPNSIREQAQHYHSNNLDFPLQESLYGAAQSENDDKKTMIAINQHQQLQFLCQMGSYPYPYPPFMNPTAHPFMHNTGSSSSGSQAFAGIPPWPMHAQYRRSPEKRYVQDTSTGEHLLDEQGEPITVERYLATKPLRKDLSTRPGPGNCQLTYMSGDVVTRTLNEAFGFNGWSVETKSQSQVGETEKDQRGRFKINFQSTVRITLNPSGAFREDVGFGDAIDRDFGTAMAHAAKSSVTDAMKRAARHFGEKLGNTLYSGSFNIRKAPVALADALSLAKKDAITSAYGQRALPLNHPSLINTKSTPSPSTKRLEAPSSINQTTDTDQKPSRSQQPNSHNSNHAAVHPSNGYSGDTTRDASGDNCQKKPVMNPISAPSASLQTKGMNNCSSAASSALMNPPTSSNNGPNHNVVGGQAMSSSTNLCGSGTTNAASNTNGIGRTLSRTVTNMGPHSTNGNPYNTTPNQVANSVQNHVRGQESQHPTQLHLQQGAYNPLVSQGKVESSLPETSNGMTSTIGKECNRASAPVNYNITRPLTDVSNRSAAVSHSSSYNGNKLDIPQQNHNYSHIAGKRAYPEVGANNSTHNPQQQQPVKRQAVNPYQIRNKI